MAFIYEAKKGGVFCEEMKVVPGPGTIFRRQALMDALARYVPADSAKIAGGGVIFRYRLRHGGAGL